MSDKTSSKLEKVKIQTFILRKQTKNPKCVSIPDFGDPPEIRTPDTLLKRQVAPFGLRPNKKPTEPAIENTAFALVLNSQRPF